MPGKRGKGGRERAGLLPHPLTPLAFEQIIPGKSLSGGTRCQIIMYEYHTHAYEQRNQTVIFYYCYPSLENGKSVVNV